MVRSSRKARTNPFDCRLTRRFFQYSIMAAETSVAVDVEQAIRHGLSCIDRVLDDSGFAFTALDVVGQALENLEPIRAYTHLRFVDLSRNQITEYAPLAELPYLVTLSLAGNAIAAATPLTNTYLQYVDLSENQLTTLQGLGSKSVSTLKVSDNQLESLTGLAELPALTSLDASRNAIVDLAALSSESAKLEHLYLNENNLASLAGVDAIKTLRVLEARQNNLDTITSLEALASLDSLTELDISLNPLNDTEHYRLLLLIQFPQLTKLDGELVTDAERLAAVDLKEQHEREAAEAEAAGDEGEDA